MCLNCEYYLDSCIEPECYEKADPYNRYENRSGYRRVLWRGHEEPCEHIKKTSPDWEEEMDDETC